MGRLNKMSGKHGKFGEPKNVKGFCLVPKIHAIICAMPLISPLIACIIVAANAAVIGAYGA